MSPFTDQLTKKLLKIDASSWRALRAQVRWCYMKWELDNPPHVLRSYMSKLPEDAILWRDYADAISKERRNGIVAERRVAARKKELKARAAKRDYQRSYMKEYRAGMKRRNST